MEQFQSHATELPVTIDISNKEIIRWDPETREKELVTKEDFEFAADADDIIDDTTLAIAEIFQSGYLELCGYVYSLASRGLPVKYL